MIEVVRYTSIKKQEWDSFIDNSKNGTFLLKRAFMDYHSDRFIGSSLMIYRKGKLVSCFPANISGDEVYSHQGLSYGGFIFSSKVRLSIAEEVLDSVISFFKSRDLKSILIKQIPYVYHQQSTNEMDYWLWRKGFEIVRKDTTLSVDLKSDFKFSSRKKRYFKKAKSENLSIVENDKLSSFWDQILVPNLKSKYELSPVHSIEEIELLKSRFTQNILQYNVYDVENNIIAGTTLFINKKTIHAQYIASNNYGTETGALDYLFITLIEKYKTEGYSFFDFGICNENNGKELNYSLVEYKEGLGGSTYIHDFYKLQL